MANSYGLNFVDQLLDRQAVYIGDIGESIYFIRKKYGKHILDPEPGIYAVDSIEPIIKSTDMVYRDCDYEKQIPFNIAYFDTLDRPLLDKDANTVLPIGVVKNKDLFLRQTPNLDIRVIKIIDAIVKECISNLVLHNACEIPLISEHLKPSGYYLVEKGVLRDCCVSLLEDVDHFVGHYQWNIYTTYLETNRIHVSRHIDYRILDWTRRMAQGEWTNNE